MLLWHIWLSMWHIKTMFRATSKPGWSSWDVIPTNRLRSLLGLHTQLELCLYKLVAYETATQPPPCSLLCLFLLFPHTVSTIELDKTKSENKGYFQWCVQSHGCASKGTGTTRAVPWQEQKSRRKSTGYVPMCLVEKAWEILTQALPVEKCLQSHSHHHAGRAAFLTQGHKCEMGGFSLSLVHCPEAWISKTLGEHPQVPLGEIRHIKKNMRRDNSPRRVLTQTGRKKVCSQQLQIWLRALYKRWNKCHIWVTRR